MGLIKFTTKEEIDKAKQSPSFGREYNLQYLGLIGNVFSQLSIENATKVQYHIRKFVYRDLSFFNAKKMKV
jgi:hypothetical protein